MVLIVLLCVFWLFSLEYRIKALEDKEASIEEQEKSALLKESIKEDAIDRDEKEDLNENIN